MTLIFFFYQLVELCSAIPLGGLEIFLKCFLFSVDSIENEEYRNFFVKEILYFSNLKSQGFPSQNNFEILHFQSNPQKKENILKTFRDHLGVWPNIALQAGKKIRVIE